MSVLAIVILLAVLGLLGWLFLKRPLQPDSGSDERAGPPTGAMPDAGGEPVRRWDEVLGVSPSAKVAEIRAAHARLMRTLGPEQLALREGEARQQAEREALAVANAYRRGLEVRGGDG